MRRGGSPEAEAARPAAILVFRDGRRTEINHYAIIGGTLWILSERQSRKILLSDLDLDATTKANEERGLPCHGNENRGDCHAI